MVNPQDYLLGAATLAAFAAFLAALFHVRGQGFDHYARAQRLAAASAVLFWAALILLLIDFVLLRLDVAYVHAHTGADVPLVYRLSGLWGGNEGTVLMWTTFAATVLALNARLWQRRVDRGLAAPPDADHPLPWTLLVGFGVVTAFGILTILDGTFDPTPAWALEDDPDGRGLQPVLKTPFMVIHPPLQFLAYGVTVLLFAAALAHLATGRREWADIALPWTRVTLLLAWTGLGLGALWAYYVLNFGGYWAWDPAETANLLFVLPLIPLVHGLIYYRKKGMFAVMAPLFAILAFLSTLFATLSVRTGLWISVHAFTDPSQIFEPDPLQRLLDVLDTSLLLQYLGSLFLAGIAVALLFYLYRLQRDRRGPSRPLVDGLHVSAVFLLGALAALAFADPIQGFALLFELAHFAYPPDAAAGLGLLLVGLAVAFSLPSIFGKEPEPRATGGLPVWLTMANLVFLGMLAVAAATLAVFLIDVMGVNNIEWAKETYLRRAPLFALPLLLILAVALSNKFIGAAASLMLAAASLLLGLVLAAFLEGPWQLLLALPALLFALFAAALKLFKVSDRGPETPIRLRWAGGLLLFGGIAALFYWANPPTRIPIPGATLYPSAWWVLAGFPLGLLSILGGVSTLRQKNYRLALVGALSLALSLAWVVALPLGVALLVALLRQRDAFEQGRTAWDLTTTARSLHRDLRKTGVYLIHVALVLGLAGYATSTYLVSEPVPLHLEPGMTATAHGYEFRLAETTTVGVEPRFQMADTIRAHVVVSRDGAVVSEAALTLVHALPQIYGEKVDVQRFALEDLYLHPTRFELSGPGATPSVEPSQDGVRIFPDTQVTAVDFTASVLPGMHLVWGGVWVLATGILIALLFGGWRMETKRVEDAP